MTLANYIRDEVLLPRLRHARVLVVYDPERRYYDLCQSMKAEGRQVIDASESSIESREAAMDGLIELGRPGSALQEMLVYVPAPPPLTDEARQHDPFAACGVCGGVFPDTDGDEYLSLCLRAKPDQATAIRRIFAQDPNPSFAVIDAVGGNVGWPNLRTLLGTESAREILIALLAPTDAQREALKHSESWPPEARDLLATTLGLKLLTRGKTWSSITDELWRYLLYSEFVFDLPVELPDALADVPRAADEAQPLVEDLCDRLRSDIRTRDLYVGHAETIERDLELPRHCRAIQDLGTRDTFPFEERSFFNAAVDALKRDNADRLRELLGRRLRSIWMNKGEIQAQWQLLQAAANLVEACLDAERQLPDHTSGQDVLVDYYTRSLREVDRLQRELEQAAGDHINVGDQTAEVTALARKAYSNIAGKAQTHFIRHLEKSGWPPSGRLANADVFDRVVQPKIQESGRRVALFMIDAVRYELGVELSKTLDLEGQITLQPAFAQLPTITPVGMVSVLPGAGRDLQLLRKDGQLVPTLAGQPVTNVSQRMDVLRKRLGDRFQEMQLREFIRPKQAFSGTVDLLVIRSNEMDSDFESNPDAAPGLISRTFQQIRVAIQRLRTLGFHDAVIVTDHGFYLNTAIEAGDVCTKPAGTWLNAHERLMLGDGADDHANFAIPAASLGIQGDFALAAGPRALVAYRAGLTYFHGGASLQEAVVPVIEVRLRQPELEPDRRPKVTLTYRRGTRTVTTRLPVMDVTVAAADIFSINAPVEILLEAHDKQGTVVGEVRPGGAVNPATRTVTLRPNETAQVTLAMDQEFEGSFTVKALDPATLTIFGKVDLETDYTV